MIDYRILTFLAICETGNYTRAAEKINITQPAVTQHIHYLEKYYDAALFRMNGKKVELTPAGEILRTAARTFISDEKKIMTEMHRREDRPVPVRIGATITIGEFIIAGLLANYQQKHPDCIVTVTIANTADLLKKLKEGEIEIALVEGNFDKQAYGNRLYRSEHFVPVASADYRFQKKPKELKDLMQERLLVREKGSGTREILERSLAAENYSLADFAKYTEINSIHTIIQLLLENAGITFLYEAAIQKEEEEDRIVKIPLRDYSIFHDFAFIWDKASIFADRYEEICEELTE